MKSENNKKLSADLVVTVDSHDPTFAFFEISAFSLYNVQACLKQAPNIMFGAKRIISKYLEPMKQAISGSILALILANILQQMMFWHPKHESLGPIE